MSYITYISSFFLNHSVEYFSYQHDWGKKLNHKNLLN